MDAYKLQALLVFCFVWQIDLILKWQPNLLRQMLLLPSEESCHEMSSRQGVSVKARRTCATNCSEWKVSGAGVVVSGGEPSVNGPHLILVAACCAAGV